LQEITGMEGTIITLQEVFSFQQQTIDTEGRIRGRFVFHGVRPKFTEKFNAVGIEVRPDLFDPSRSLRV
jgi:pilus assembly protein CpaF